MFHFILGVIGIAFYVILSIVFLPIGYFIGLFSKPAMRKYAFYYGKAALATVGFLIGMKVEVKGRDKITKEEPVLFICNHRSLQDIIATWNLLPFRACYMAKQELVNIPVFGWWVKMTGGIGVMRHDHKQAMRALLTCYDKVRNKESVFIFPEGTRNKNEDPAELLPFKAGAKKVAQKCGCIVQPIAVNHSDCFENHLPKFYKEKSVVEFLEPFYYEELSDENKAGFDEYVRNMIAEAVRRNEGEIR